MNFDEYEEECFDDEPEEQAKQFHMQLSFPTDELDNDELFDAQVVLSSHGAAATTIASIQESRIAMGDDLTHVAMLLKSQSESKDTGEKMLKTQSITLDLAFNQLLDRAVRHSDLKVSEQLMKLAFKAQAQCRANLTAISDIRHPKITNHIGQVNHASGPQQVNNEADTRGGKCETGKINQIKTPNELTEGLTDDVLQDIRAPAGSKRAD